MDPNACYDAMLEASIEGDRKAAYQHASNLIGWLAKGGFLPKGFAEHQRKIVSRITLAIAVLTED